MNIFLRRIPANTQHDEIADFIRPVLKNGFFGKPGRIVNIEILALRDLKQGSIEYHGLVTLESGWSDQKAINRLKNRRLNGRYVTVRPFFQRSWSNDPREHSASQGQNEFIEKRQGDRRRGKQLEVVKNVSDYFSVEDGFFNTVNHQQFQITFIVSAEVENAVAECLVSFEHEHAKSTPEPNDLPQHGIVRFLTEMEGPENKSRRFQIYATRHVIAALLEKLKAEFSGNSIYYWITPVIEFGVI
ncbi:MAG: RNA-binding protein [Methylomonas lenta]|jgi:hypothetical protein|nr:RNA-binding protein [Methylomonas lenta]